MGENYLANFVQAAFDTLEETKAPVKGGTLVISGDGRCSLQYPRVLSALTVLITFCLRHMNMRPVVRFM
jgi:hypothetical protein